MPVTERWQPSGRSAIRADAEAIHKCINVLLAKAVGPGNQETGQPPCSGFLVEEPLRQSEMHHNVIEGQQTPWRLTGRMISHIIPNGSMGLR
jgi:hypothetical protein